MLNHPSELPDILSFKPDMHFKLLDMDWCNDNEAVPTGFRGNELEHLNSSGGSSTFLKM